MKKIFTLIAMALMAVSANAQNYMIAVDQWPWNYKVTTYPQEMTIEYGQWGTFILASGQDFSKLKGMKIEYVAFPETAGVDGEGNPSYINLKYGDGTDANSKYLNLDAAASSAEIEFTEETTAITAGQVGLQGAVDKAKITLKKFVLIAADGTETELTGYSGDGQNLWNVHPYIVGGQFSFTGQYGGLQIVNADGTPVTYKNDGTDTDTREIVFTFGAPTPEGLILELDDANGGFTWPNVEAGVETLTLTLSPETVGSTAEDGTFTAKNLETLYLKAGGADGYPKDLSIVSIAAPGGTGVQTLKANTQKSDVRYNLAGQKVDASYKGVVIMNGKKMVVK